MRHDGAFKLCKELGKMLHEVMGWPGPMTEPQFLAWQMWLDPRTMWFEEERPVLTPEQRTSLEAWERQRKMDRYVRKGYRVVNYTKAEWEAMIREQNKDLVERGLIDG